MAIFPRHAEPRIRAALRDTRVVAITGPRQSGKTTLARRFTQQRRTYLTLDDRATLAAAKSDPVAFIQGLDRVVIDEIQRAPELLLAIKRSVDEDRRAGRFLLTGSANLATIAPVHESLAGRIETIPLYPLARSELIRNNRPRFIDKAFSGGIPAPPESLRHDALPEIISQGGYPEALMRKSQRRRQDWYRAYVESIAVRDAPEIASLAKASVIPRLLQISAQLASSLVNLSEIGRATALNHKTTDHYLQVLEQLFLVRRLPPWSRNELSRIVKTPKLHFIDSGLLAALRGYSVARLRSDRDLLGPILEGFVFSELLKSSAWSEERISLFHYRDKDQREVDFVLENDAGQIVGLEVKAAASVTRGDFAGLDRLASASGSRFIQGILLYNGEHALSFGEKLRAAPLTVLWG